MSLFTRSAKTKIVSSAPAQAAINLDYFKEDDFETNDDFQFDAFCTALGAVASRIHGGYPSLASDDFSSLDGLI